MMDWRELCIYASEIGIDAAGKWKEVHACLLNDCYLHPPYNPYIGVYANVFATELLEPSGLRLLKVNSPKASWVEPTHGYDALYK